MTTEDPEATVVGYSIDIVCDCSAGGRLGLSDMKGEWFCPACRQWYRAQVSVMPVPTPCGAHPDRRA
jgi:hypothetical protein